MLDNTFLSLTPEDKAARKPRDYTYYRERRRELDRGRTDRSNYDAAAERVREKVRRAVASGEIIRPDRCQGCRLREDKAKPERKLSAHHDDHEKPLDVQWLCPRCHSRRHVMLGRLGRTTKSRKARLCA
jgi:hypothetical protein